MKLNERPEARWATLTQEKHRTNATGRARPPNDLIRDLVEVSYPPGGRSAEHRPPGFIVGYVLEGQIRFAINHETPRVLRRGEMFYEPTGALHSTSENAQPGMPAKILAFMVAPPGRPVVEGK